MNITISFHKDIPIAEIKSDKVEINDVQDALDLIANCDYRGSRSIIIDKSMVTPDFFDLSTRIAGEILQKFSTYRVKLSIIGDYSEFDSKSLRDFIYESNKVGRISFVNSREEALEILTDSKSCD